MAVPGYGAAHERRLDAGETLVTRDVSTLGWANGPNLVNPHSMPGYIGAIVFGWVLCLLGLAVAFDYRGVAHHAQDDNRWPATLPPWCIRAIGAIMFVSGVVIGIHGVALLVAH